MIHCILEWDRLTATATLISCDDVTTVAIQDAITKGIGTETGELKEQQQQQQQQQRNKGGTQRRKVCIQT